MRSSALKCLKYFNQAQQLHVTRACGRHAFAALPSVAQSHIVTLGVACNELAAGGWCRVKINEFSSTPELRTVQADITENQFHEVADHTMDTLHDAIEVR